MKKAIAILFSMLFIVSSISGQKGKDDGGSDEKTENNEPNNNPDENQGDNECMNTALDITALLFGAYQTKLINSSSNPSATSFEIMLHGGVAYNGNEMFISAFPRVRLNYGALSGDFRYTYMDQGILEPLSTFDAILDFNIIVGKSFKMSIGQGIMYSISETESNIYHESFLGMDIGIMDRMILISPEFRLAYDWNTKTTVNSELTLRGGYRVFNISSFSIYANIAGAYQYLGPNTSNTLIYGGFDIFIQ